MDLFKSQSFPSLIKLLKLLALYPYNTRVVLGVIDIITVLVIYKIFTKYSSLANVQQTAQEFFNNSIEQNSVIAIIADRISISKLVVVVSGVIVAAYGNPLVPNGHIFSLTVTKLKANILAKLFQIAQQIIQLDMVEEIQLFLIGFTALHPKEVLKRNNMLYNIKLYTTNESINISKVTAPCKTPLLKKTVCTIC